MLDPSTPPMTCSACREALSARLDGEPPGAGADQRLAHHLASCTDCTRFEQHITELTRRTRIGAADAVPDLTAAIIAQVSPLTQPSGSHSKTATAASVRRTRDLRRLVAVAGIAQLILALPMLLGMVSPDTHLGRDLGALQLALGVGLICVAVQPRRAHGLLPVLTVVAAVTVVAATLDVATGAASLLGELTHLTEVIGVPVVWALARRTAPHPWVSTSRRATAV